MSFILIKAQIEDRAEIENIISKSVRTLGLEYYTPKQIEGALKFAWGLDTQLILDETYFVVKDESSLIACGGWSYRETLFGNDTEKSRNDNIINPNIGAAKIRAFFVLPEYSRKGIGSLLMKKCERDAAAMGYRSLELMATLPGKQLYSKHDFIPNESINYSLGEDLSIEFVPMIKNLD